MKVRNCVEFEPRTKKIQSISQYFYVLRIIKRIQLLLVVLYAFLPDFLM
jgi:hypothetical protein